MKVRPLCGLSPPTSAAAAAVVSPPYDAISPDDARALLAKGTAGFLRVVLPEAVLPDAESDDENTQHTASSNALDALTNSGQLKTVPEPCFFAYELRVAKTGHVQTGVAALVSIDDYVNGVIKKHEHTRTEKEHQRAALATALCAHTGPVLLAHRPDKGVLKAVEETKKDTPALAVEQGGVAHTLWKITPDMTTVVEKAFDGVEAAYIADGHHRAAAAARVGIERRAVGGTQMERESDWFPAVLFPATELVSRPYYRAVSDLRPHADAAGFLGCLRQLGVSFTPLPCPPDADAEGKGEVFMALKGEGVGQVNWFRVELEVKEGEVVYGVLQENVFGPVLGIDDARTDGRVEFVGGVTPKELADWVRMGSAKVAFAPSAVQAGEMMGVVDGGNMMPPKSTWFEPKLCSGFFVHMF